MKELDKGRRQKERGTFGWWGPLGGGVRGQKSTTFCFCFHSNAEAFKRIKTQ